MNIIPLTQKTAKSLRGTFIMQIKGKDKIRKTPNVPLQINPIRRSKNLGPRNVACFFIVSIKMILENITQIDVTGLKTAKMKMLSSRISKFLK